MRLYTDRPTKTQHALWISQTGLWVTENSRDTSSQSITVKLDALIGKHLEIIHGTETKVSAAESDAPEGTQLWQTPLGAQTRVFFECWFHRVRTDLLPCKRKLASVLNDRQTWVCCLWKPLHWMCHKTSEKTMEKLYIKISQALEGQQCKYTPWLTRCLHYK